MEKGLLQQGLTREELVNIHELYPPLEWEGGWLRFDGHNVTDLAKNYGTPLVAYSGNRIATNLNRLQAAFSQNFKSVRVATALKACYLPACARTCLEAGASIEVMSEIELELALVSGVSGGHIIANGVAKTPSYMEVPHSYRTGSHQRHAFWSDIN